jgi:hypothetical protein
MEIKSWMVRFARVEDSIRERISIFRKEGFFRNLLFRYELEILIGSGRGSANIPEIIGWRILTWIVISILIRIISIAELIKSNTSKKSEITSPYRYKWLKITEFSFSAKTQKDTFEPAMADWDEEIFEALQENKDARLFMINLRNTYGYILAMWQKSPIGDLLEYVRKFAS